MSRVDPKTTSEALLANFGTNRRTLLGALSGGALLGIFSGCTSKGGDQDASLRVADQLEYFQAIFRASGQLDQALPYDIAWSNFVSGPALISAATGGSVDIGWTASTPLIFSQAAGSPVKIIGAFDSIPAADGRSGMGIVVAANSPIRSIADLRGKRVSYALGTITQYIAHEALASAGLSLKDITPILSTVERAAPLLENGHTDALVAVEPILSRLVESGQGRILARATDHTRELHYVVAPTATLTDPAKVEQLHDFLKRLSDGLDWWGANPKAAAEETARLYRVPPQIAEVISAHIVRKSIPVTDDVIAFQQRQADAFLAEGQINKSIDVRDIFDARFVSLGGSPRG